MANLDRSGERLRNLVNDVGAVTRACSEDKNCPFKGFEYKDFVFKFEYLCKNVKKFYWINFTEDYPNGSMMTWSVNGSSEHCTKAFDLPLPFEFNRLAREMYKDIPIPVISSSKSSQDDEGNATDEDEEYMDEDEEDMEEECSAYYDFCDEATTSKGSKPPALNEMTAEFELLQAFCEDVKMNRIPGLDEVYFMIPISTDFLEDELARAWKLIPKQPIYIQVLFYESKYSLAEGFGKVDVFQENPDREAFGSPEKLVPGILVQLQSILQTFMKGERHELIRATEKKLNLKELKNKVKKKFFKESVLDPISDPKKAPGLKCGPLVELMAYAQQRLPVLNAYCVICDDPHPFANIDMLKPMVCIKPLCVFSYQTLGVMSNVAESMATEYEVVDLLVAMAKAACYSSRNQLIFDPFPTIVNPKNSSELAFSLEKKNFKQVQTVMSKFLQMKEMINLNPVVLKKTLDERDIFLFPLLQWIISSNRSHIVKLKPEKQLDFMKTPHQFLLRSSPPAKEAAFNTAKEKYGSVFAFHGSSIENWHSILRKGLINASGTNLQRNGAAYGNGIYLSPNASLSFNYCQTSFGVNFFQSKRQKTDDKDASQSLQLLSSDNIVCIALCEVVNSKDLKKNANDIWVMPTEDYVVTRFLFVYESKQCVDASIKCTYPAILSQIKASLAK